MLANRITWGATTSTVEKLQVMGIKAYLNAQLHAGKVAALPKEVQIQIDALTISQRPLVDLIQNMEQRRKEADANSNDDVKKTALQAYQAELNLFKVALRRFVWKLQKQRWWCRAFRRRDLTESRLDEVHPKGLAFTRSKRGRPWKKACRINMLRRKPCLTSEAPTINIVVTVFCAELSF
jgi:hypothetical protein